MTEKDKYQMLLDELIGPLKGFVTTLTKKSELLANKVKSIIGNEDSDEKYPTVKAVYKFVCESIGNISFDGYEITKNKVKKLDDTSTDEQYPSAKAVFDLMSDIEISGGADGFSPIAKVEQTDEGATITITDKKGTTSATVKNGKDGTNGTDGKDGTSVTVKSVSESTADGGSSVVTFSDGKTLTVKNGSKGSKGDKGDTGSQGAKGDKGDKGDTGATGSKGTDGYTPVKGTDYFTEADKAELVQMVIKSLGGNPVFGYVDENNNIIVSGNLADGSYNVKYEMEDGSMVDIGDLVLDTRTYYTVKNNLTNCTSNNNTTEAVEGGSYSATITAKSGYELKSVTVTMGGSPVSVSGGVINIASVTGDIVITAVATEVQTNDTDNILTNGAYTIEMNKRWSNSSKSYSACDGMICITIPTADVLNKTIYFKGFTKDLQSSGSKALWMAVDESLTKQSVPRSANSDGCIWGATYLTDEGNGAYSLAVNSTSFTGDVSSTTYLKLNMAVNASTAVTSLDGLTMTIDKPIS